MATTVPLSSISVSDLERRLVADAVESGWLSANGPEVRRFESLLCERVQAAAAVATCSGTTALLLALKALDVGPGDEVIVPALTFAATAAAVVNVGAVPVFADVDPDTWTLSPSACRRAMSSRTRAIIAVDPMGNPCDFGALRELGVPIVEDAAHAHGGQGPHGPAGACADVGVFSFHANKTVSTGQGGALVVHAPDLAERARLLSEHGAPTHGTYEHTLAGLNVRMGNLSAAFGAAQIARWDELVARRIEVAGMYDDLLSSIGLGRQAPTPGSRPAVWLYTRTSAHRGEILDSCRRHGIDARAIWTSLPDVAAFRRYARLACPHAERIGREGFWLPTFHDIRDADVELVASVVAASFASHA